MGSHGITDKVAIVGMACTKFGEHWGMGTDDLVLQAAEGAFDSAGVGTATAHQGQAGHPGRELLRVRFRGAAAGGLRGVERRL